MIYYNYKLCGSQWFISLQLSDFWGHISTWFSSQNLYKHFDHKKSKISILTLQILPDYCMITRNETHEDMLPHVLPFIQSTSDMKNKFQMSLDKYSFLDVISRIQRFLETSKLIRFLGLLGCLGSDPCWNKTLTNYHVCPRCVLWRHGQWGGNWGEWHAALQGWLSVHWP